MSSTRARHTLVAAALATAALGATTAVLTTAVLTTAVLTDAAPAGAATTCTAWATMPATVSITAAHVAIHPQLVGTSGCAAGSFDNGATATLEAAHTKPYSQRWSNFGAHQQIDWYAALVTPGRYVLTHGNVQVYSAGAQRISSTWRTTTTDVRFGAAFTGTSAKHGAVTATLTRYGKDGWYTAGGVKVALQHRTGTGWTNVALARTASNGKVRFDRAVNSSYRIVSASSGAVWPAAHSL